MAKLAIIGSGVVGQATGKGFLNKKHDVTFSDVNADVLATLSSQGLKTCLSDTLGNGEEEFDAFFLSVSTPTVEGKIKLDFLKSAVEGLGKGALGKSQNYCIVVIRSTVPPGTIKGMLIPLLEEHSGKKAGRDFGVCMNPEYLREVSNEDDFKNPWIVVIGELDEESGVVLRDIYGPHECPIVRISIDEAEAQKYVHNLFNACKISFFNEMRSVCEAVSVDANKVFGLVAQSAEASWNREYGIRDMGPYGGSCLPKDTMALLTWAREELSMHLPLLGAVIEVNNALKRR